MARAVEQSEIELIRLVSLMHKTLESVVKQGVPQTYLEQEAKQVDAVMMQLEKEREQESARIDGLVRSLDMQKRALVAAVGSLCDVSEDVLDEELRALNRRNVELGVKIVEKYDEAAKLVDVIEEEILQHAIPPI